MIRKAKSYISIVLAAGMIATGTFAAFAQVDSTLAEMTDSDSKRNSGNKIKYKSTQEKKWRTTYEGAY